MYCITIVLAIKFECGVMKVGNSTVMVLPKSLCHNFGIKKNTKLQVLATENGLYVPLKEKKELNEEIQEWIKTNKGKKYVK